ncbi:unnamed protein product [Chrysoparadoxa australica]
MGLGCSKALALMVTIECSGAFAPPLPSSWGTSPRSSPFQQIMERSPESSTERMFTLRSGCSSAVRICSGSFRVNGSTANLTLLHSSKEAAEEDEEVKTRPEPDRRGQGGAADTLPDYLAGIDESRWEKGVEEERTMDVPDFDLLEESAFGLDRPTDYLGDLTLEAIAEDYCFPLEFLCDIMCRWGVTPPIKITDKLGDLVNQDQAYAIAEALTSLDAASLQEYYIEDSLDEIADNLDVSLAEVFSICAKRRFSLPLGTDTHLNAEEYSLLLRDLGEDDWEILEDTSSEGDRAARFKSDLKDLFVSDLFKGDADVMFDDE